MCGDTTGERKVMSFDHHIWSRWTFCLYEGMEREKWMNELMGWQVNCAPTQYGRLLQSRRSKMNDRRLSVLHCQWIKVR